MIFFIVYNIYNFFKCIKVKMKSADLWDNVVNGRENVVDAIPKIKLERNNTFCYFYSRKVTGKKLLVHAVFVFYVAKI